MVQRGLVSVLQHDPSTAPARAAKLQKNGAQLIVLTPELPDKSLSTSEKHDLKFEVLSGIVNKVANYTSLSLKSAYSLYRVHKLHYYAYTIAALRLEAVSMLRQNH